jgi:outer membrane protein W
MKTFQKIKENGKKAILGLALATAMGLAANAYADNSTQISVKGGYAFLKPEYNTSINEVSVGTGKGKEFGNAFKGGIEIAKNFGENSVGLELLISSQEIGKDRQNIYTGEISEFGKMKWTLLESALYFRHLFPLNEKSRIELGAGPVINYSLLKDSNEAETQESKAWALGGRAFAGVEYDLSKTITAGIRATYDNIFKGSKLNSNGVGIQASIGIKFGKDEEAKPKYGSVKATFSNSTESEAK